MLTPCINVCILEGQICIGCGRTADQIAVWPFLTHKQRAFIIANLAPVQKDKNA